MTKYVLGFAFSEDLSKVLLIRKDHPEWQKGKLNGVGGKINSKEFEHHIEAMVREFKEEVGIDSSKYDWHHLVDMSGPGWECRVYWSYTLDIEQARQLEAEEPVIKYVCDLMEEVCIENVPWLVHLALDRGVKKGFQVFYT